MHCRTSNMSKACMACGSARLVCPGNFSWHVQMACKCRAMRLLCMNLNQGMLEQSVYTIKCVQVECASLCTRGGVGLCGRCGRLVLALAHGVSFASRCRQDTYTAWLHSHCLLALRSWEAHLGFDELSKHHYPGESNRLGTSRARVRAGWAS